MRKQAAIRLDDVLEVFQQHDRPLTACEICGAHMPAQSRFARQSEFNASFHIFEIHERFEDLASGISAWRP